MSAPLPSGIATAANPTIPAAKPGRLIHREGAVFHATFQAAIIPPWLSGVPLFRSGEDRPAVVRGSTFISLHRPWPEVLCLAIKLLDPDRDGEEQDLLLFSTFAKLPANAFPSWRFRAAGTQFSSAMSYRRADQRIMFGARLPPAAPLGHCHPGWWTRIKASRKDLLHRPCSPWEELEAMMRRPDFDLEIVTATAGGRWWHAGTLRSFSDYGPDGDWVRYRPGHTCAELPLSRFGTWRDRVYGYVQSRP